MATKAIQAFQLIEEYNTMLFSWYYKGFEFLRHYLVKDHFGANLEDLDFEEVDKEMEANEAAQAIVATKENVLEEDIADPKGAPTNVAGGDEAVT